MLYYCGVPVILKEFIFISLFKMNMYRPCAVAAQQHHVCGVLFFAFNLPKDNSAAIQLTPALPSYFNSGNQLTLMLQVSEAAMLSDLSAQR